MKTISRYLMTLVALFALSTGAWADNSDWHIDIAAGQYYLVDAESGKMMAAGHSGSIQGIVNETGLDLTITPNSSTRKVSIDSRVTNPLNGGHFLGSNLLMGGNEYGWALLDQGSGFYILDPGSNKYINIDANDDLVLSDTPREWLILTPEDVKNNLLNKLSRAKMNKPVDATGLLTAPNFNRGDARNYEAWTVSKDCSNYNLSGGANNNNCAESYHQTFTISQTVSGAPAGIYQMTAQGFYRQDSYTGDAPAAPTFFANDVTCNVPARTGSENGMSDASASFTAGSYTIDPIEFEVTEDGVINLGIISTTTTQWIAWDNFRLTYLGPVFKATLDAAAKQATFTMPASDVTVDYELVRDLSVEATANITVGEGEEAETLTADTRVRIQKTDNGYEFVKALSISFSDDIEEVSITKDGFAAAKLVPQFYIQQDDEQNPWVLVTDDNLDETTGLPNNLQPGQVYCLTFVPADESSLYDGETLQSVTITLFEGYEVEVPGDEYVTFYKEENLYVESEEAQLYTITDVGEETATSVELNVAAAYTPMLVKNNTSETKTFLLIPTTDEADDVTPYAGFMGTLEATQIPASDATKNNYAFNGLKFVWVKNAINIAANKAWLEVPTGASTPKSRTLTLVFGETTGVDGVPVQPTLDGTWYDLNGRKLEGMPKRKGVYILNGRKVVVK